MAADLGQLRVSIDAQQALTTAQQLAAALKALGQQGQQTVTDLAGLQKIAAQPVAGGAGAGQAMAEQTAQMVTGMKQAMMIYQEMATQGAGAGGLGAGFTEAANAARTMVDALGGALAIFSDMIGEGKSVQEVMATMVAQIAEMPNVLKGMSAEGRSAFEVLMTGAREATEGEKQFTNAARDLGVQVSNTAKSFQQLEAAQQRMTNVQRTSREEMNRSPLGGAASTLTNVMMGQQMMTGGGIMNTVFGIQQLWMALKEASSGVQIFGSSFAGMMGILAGAAAAIAGIVAAVKLLGDAMRTASENEQFGLRLQGMGANANQTQEQVQQLHELGAKGGFSMDDILGGLTQLRATGSSTSIDALTKISDIAVGTGQSFTRVASDVSRLTEQIEVNRKSIERELETLVRTGVITGDTANKIAQLHAAGAGTKAQLDALNEGLTQFSGMTEKAGNLTQGLQRQMADAFKQSFAPIGAALNQAFDSAMRTLTEQFKGLGEDITQGVQTGNWAPLIEHLAADAFQNAVTTFTALITQGVPNAFHSVGTTVATLIRDWTQPLSDAIVSGAQAAWNTVTGFVSDSFNTWRTLISPAITGGIQDGWNAVVSWVQDSFTNWTQWAHDALMNGFQEVLDTVGNADWWASVGTALGDAIKNGAQGALDWIKGEIAWITDPKNWSGRAQPGQEGFETEKGIPAPSTTENILPPATVYGGGGTEKTAKAAKEAKDDYSDLDHIIKEIANTEKIATGQAQMYTAESKAGLISIQTAASATSDIYSKELQTLQSQQPVLQQQIDLAEQRMNAEQGNTKAAEKSRDEYLKGVTAMTELQTKMAEIQALQAQLGTGSFTQNFVQGVREATNAWGTFGQQTIQLGKQITDELASGLGNGITQLLEGTGKLSDAFKSMADSIIKSIDDMIAKMIIQWSWEQILGLLGQTSTAGAAQVAGSGASAVLHAQSGGLVAGPTGTDKVPASLTSGEFVINQRAVDKYGLAMIQAINAGTWQPGMSGPKMAMGGFVGAPTTSYNVPPSMNPTPGSSGQLINVVTNVTVPGGGGVSGGISPETGSLSKEQVAQFQTVLNQAVKQVIITEKRPGGLLSRQQLA